MNAPAAEQRGIRCHAGLDPASSLHFWIPAFAGMTICGKRLGIEPAEIKIIDLKPMPAINMFFGEPSPMFKGEKGITDVSFENIEIAFQSSKSSVKRHRRLLKDRQSTWAIAVVIR